MLESFKPKSLCLLITISVSLSCYSVLHAVSLNPEKKPSSSPILSKGLEEEVAVKKEGEGPFKFDSYFRYLPTRGAKDMDGRLGIIDSAYEASYEVKAFDNLPVEFSLSNRYIGINDTVTQVDLPPHLIGVVGDVETTLPFFDFKKTYLRVGVSPAFYKDDWNFESSNFRLLSRYYMIYQPNDKWTFIAGVLVTPDFENEAWPILGFIYKPNDRLTFNIVPERATVNYALNKKTSIFAVGDISISEFEVTRESSKNVILFYKASYLGGGVELKLNRFISASLATGAVFNRTLKYRDDQGKVNIKDDVYTEFRLQIAM